MRNLESNLRMVLMSGSGQTLAKKNSGMVLEKWLTTMVPFMKANGVMENEMEKVG